ncbi:hypothetical protein OVY01_18500 [Robbsia sp. Bb-Pol-6]|uniref:Uncharacterized protein n=1 Tax=Robbsia betulipollinis TaxID=2981849 RepID=A0ABT3ZRG4_9BURK|nr:hypothetical protein [Robbsia betulipollinis]MCY0389140.1 hypothetical protein [Robbsia betulipollinis]
MDWLLEIDDSEMIVRGMCSPYHVSSKGKIKPEAFDPTPDTDEVSVMRANIIGPDACKDRAFMLQDITHENPSKHKIYRGLGAIMASSIRKSKVDVVDSRDVFEGHADIKLGVVVPRGEPLPPEELLKVRAITKALAQATRYFEDPVPSSSGWAGAPIETT